MSSQVALMWSSMAEVYHCRLCLILDQTTMAQMYLHVRAIWRLCHSEMLQCMKGKICITTKELKTSSINTSSLYSRSSPCDHSFKRPALVTTTFAKFHLKCDLNFVMKSSCKRPRPRPLLGLPNWTFPCF